MDKSSVTFISCSKEVKTTIQNLAMSALGASGKILRKILRENVPLRSKKFKNHIATWKHIDKSTGQPQLDIGFYGWQKVKSRGKQPSHASPWWIEYGTKPHFITPKNANAMGYDNNFFGKSVNHPGQKATNILRNTVYDNIDTIRAAQAEYLAELNKTLEEAGAKVNLGEEEETD